MKYAGFALRRMRTKNSCWFGLPPAACFRRPRARPSRRLRLARFCACFALTAARAIGPQSTASGAPACLRSKSTASQIEPSKRTHIGSSSRNVVTGSGPGRASAMPAMIR